MKLYFILVSIIMGFTLNSCKKSFLDKKPNDNLVVPTTLPDLQAMLDHDRFLNGSTVANLGGPTPILLETGTDNWYIRDAEYQNGSLHLRNVYRWAKTDVWGGVVDIEEWNQPYKAILYANIALDGVDKIAKTEENTSAWNNVKGSALFFRSFVFYQLAQTFAPVYDSRSAASELGIVLRLKSDISEPSVRASLQETYDQVLNDLAEASKLLPTTQTPKTRPSKWACYAMLARVYLSMGDYNNAFRYADSSLSINNQLLNYSNTADPDFTGSTTSYSIKRYNKEVIFTAISNSTLLKTLFFPTSARVDSTLYNSYIATDKRKSLFYLTTGNPARAGFRGSYEQGPYPFTGLANNEMYLIRAECHARNGRNADAIGDLNKLLSNRITSYVNDTAINDNNAVLQKILTERRKELIFRCLRWTDLRRLNKEGAGITLERRVNGVESYTLPPGDLRWIWPIPDNVIGFNPGMQQNPR